MLRKSIFIFMAAAFVISGVSAFAANLPDTVATVNGEKISKQELTSALIDWNAAQALDQLIMYRLVGQEARKAGVVVTAKDIQAKFDEMKKNLPPGQSFAEMLTRNGLTPGHAFSVMKMQLQTEAILKKQIKVTVEDLDGFRRARHILIRTPYAADPKEKEKNEADAKAKVEQIAKEIKDGLAFDEAANKYSEDPGSKAKGGDLDYFGRNQMAPEFDKAVFEMTPGQISDPIKTAYGYHLIQYIGTGKDAKGADKKKLEEMIAQTKMGDKYRDWVLMIRNKAKIVNVIEPEKPQPAVQRPAPGTPPPPTEGPGAGASDAERATGAGTPPPPPPPPDTGTPPPPPDAGTPPPPPPPPDAGTPAPAQ